MTREQILSAKPTIEGPIDVPTWGGAVHVRRLSAVEMFRWGTSDRGDDNTAAAASLVVRCVCDDLGTRLLNDEDAATLQNQDASVLELLYPIAAKLNRVGKYAATTENGGPAGGKS